MFRSSTITLTEQARACSRRSNAAFTLVEVLVSMTILLMMLLIITQVIGTTQKTWHAASARLSQFREARTAFDTITRGLSQATINPYRDFDYGTGTPGVPPALAPLAAPLGYVASADLGLHMGNAPNIFTGFGSSNTMPGHAVIFQAPLGYTGTEAYRPLTSLLCISGYFVLFGTDLDYLPTGLVSRLQPKSRFRLYQYQPTTESNPVYNNILSGTRGAWATVEAAVVGLDKHPVAENILALILAPSFAIVAEGGAVVPLGHTLPASVYEFNSYTDAAHKYQLPTSVQVVMVAMDEESASRIEQKYGTSAPTLFNATFSTPANLEADLRTVRLSLEKIKVNFRIFTSTVFIPAADK